MGDSLVSPNETDKGADRASKIDATRAAPQYAYDGWLDRHFRGLRRRLTVLELGCGNGADTAYLALHGHSVTSCDNDADKLERIKKTYPGVTTSRFDMRGGFPFASDRADIVIASLCLHFFDEAETQGILTEIRRVLKKGGAFLCRLMSEKAYIPGVPGETELAPGLYMTRDGVKQFYNKERVRTVFSGWSIKGITEYDIERPTRPIAVLEVVMC